MAPKAAAAPPSPKINRLVDHTLLNTLDFCLFPEKPISKQKSLISFSRVCRRWRKVALECPRLWSFIRLDSQIDLREHLNIWIERSQQHHLDMHIYVCLYNPDQFGILDQLLIKEISRTRSLTIVQHFGGGLTCIKNGLASPVLESLVLGFGGKSYPPTSEQSLLNFPCLKALALTDATWPLIQTFKIPMKVLRELTVNYRTDRVGGRVPRCSWLTFLKNCEQLTTLKLDIFSVALENNASSNLMDPAILHKLTHLKVTLNHSVDANQNLSLLENIQTPLLQYFHFEGPDPQCSHQLQSDVLFNILRPIMKSCQETLLELSLCNVSFSALQATGLLAYGKRIKQLDITHFSLLQALVPPLESHPMTWLCPFLEKLTTCAALPEFVELLERRASTGGALCPNKFCYIKQINIIEASPSSWRCQVVLLKQIDEIRRCRNGVVISGLDELLRFTL